MDRQRINNKTDLRNAIQQLQRKIAGKEMEIAANVKDFKEAVQPKNLLKDSFSSFSQTPELKKVLINAALGFAVGFFIKKPSSIFSEDSILGIAQNILKKQFDSLEEKYKSNFVGKTIRFFKKYIPANQ